MAKIDEAKEFTGFLKLLFATFVALVVSMIAWLFNNADNSHHLVSIGSLFLIVIFSACVLFITKAILYNIKKLENL